MRLKSIIAPLLFSACVLPFLLSASPRPGTGSPAPGQPARPLHGAKGRHALGHLRKVSEAALALARNLAHESRPDQESALDLSR